MKAMYQGSRRQGLGLGTERDGRALGQTWAGIRIRIGTGTGTWDGGTPQHDGGGRSRTVIRRCGCICEHLHWNLELAGQAAAGVRKPSYNAIFIDRSARGLAGWLGPTNRAVYFIIFFFLHLSRTSRTLVLAAGRRLGLVGVMTRRKARAQAA